MATMANHHGNTSNNLYNNTSKHVDYTVQHSGTGGFTGTLKPVGNRQTIEIKDGVSSGIRYNRMINWPQVDR